MKITIEKLKKIIDIGAELIKEVLEEILPLKKNSGGKDEKK
jgi:hypothetical protein